MKIQELEELVNKVADLVSERYVCPDLAKTMRDMLLNNFSDGKYSHINTSEMFAQELTADLKAVCNDVHLSITVDPDLIHRVRDVLKNGWPIDNEDNFGVKEVKILKGNVGYINLTGFFDVKDAGDTIASAMELLSRSNALIFDLRENGGGSPDMVQFLISYLFDRKPFLLSKCFIRETNTVDEYWTLPYIPGRRFSDVNVYILTSKDTFSAAEDFSYNLKELNRASVIGEITRGGAHPAIHHPLNDELCILIPHSRIINSATGSSWEAVGVVPDIEVPSEEALDVAYGIALDKLKSKSAA